MWRRFSLKAAKYRDSPCDAGRRIRCKTLVLWGDQDGNRPNALDTWKHWADDVQGGPLPCGHFIPEEAPEALLKELLPFLGTSHR